MADVKWIKIVTDIFDDEKILLIESMPDADSIIVIWFKLLCLAGKQNNGGTFVMSNRIAYTDEMLATIFRRPLNTVRLALQVFEDFGMIEVIDGVICIPNWDKHQDLDGLQKIKEQTRQRVARHRELKRITASEDSENDSSRDCNVTCNATVTLCNATDKIRIDKIREDNKDICVAEAPQKTTKKFIKPSLEEVKAYCAERHNNVDAERFLNYYDSNGWKVGKNPMKDWKAAVRTWEQSDKAAGQNRNGPKGFNSFPQREYDMDSLEAKLLRGGA